MEKEKNLKLVEDGEINEYDLYKGIENEMINTNDYHYLFKFLNAALYAELENVSMGAQMADKSHMVGFCMGRMNMIKSLLNMKPRVNTFFDKLSKEEGE